MSSAPSVTPRLMGMIKACMPGLKLDGFCDIMKGESHEDEVLGKNETQEKHFFTRVDLCYPGGSGWYGGHIQERAVRHIIKQ